VKEAAALFDGKTDRLLSGSLLLSSSLSELWIYLKFFFVIWDVKDAH
jgi:hypothetical protein